MSNKKYAGKNFIEVIMNDAFNDVRTLLGDEMSKDAAIKAEVEAMESMDEVLKSPQMQKILEKVKVRLKEMHPEMTEETITKLIDIVPHVVAKELQHIIYPVGKVNDSFGTLFEEAKNGQIAIAVEKKGSKKNAEVLYSIDFEKINDVSISKKLTAFDKRVYIAVGALYNAGNKTTTATQIHFAMGNKKSPSLNQLKKINDSLTKMMLTHIYIH